MNMNMTTTRHPENMASSFITETPFLQNTSWMLHQQNTHIPLPVYVAVMAMIDIVGLIGNSLVIVVTIKGKMVYSFFDLMVLNLAISDLTVTILCIPLDIPLILEGKWMYGEAFCSLYYPIGSAQLFSSVFTLINITYARYQAICYPFRNQPTLRLAKLMILVIRLCSTALVVPLIVVLKYDEDNHVCYEDWKASSQNYYTITVFFLGFALPLVVLTIGYWRIMYELFATKKDGNLLVRDRRTIRRNRRSVNLSVAVTVTFGACVLPNQVVFMLYTFASLEKYKHHLDLLLGSHMLLFLYCALNPIIYNVCSKKFRNEIKCLFRKSRNR